VPVITLPDFKQRNVVVLQDQYSGWNESNLPDGAAGYVFLPVAAGMLY